MDKICGLCGAVKQADLLLCRSCYGRYTAAVVAELKEGRGTTFLDWVEAEAKAKLLSFQQDTAAKKRALDELQERNDREVDEELRKLLNGQSFPQDELRKLRETIRGKRWAELGGNRVFAEAKNTETRNATAIKLLKELLERIPQERFPEASDAVNAAIAITQKKGDEAP